MASVLNKIIAYKKQEVCLREKDKPLVLFKNDLKRSNRSLYDSLFTASYKSNQPAFILECKKASPSKGLINKNFDPIQISQTYDRYAAAISVLTDSHYFQGDHHFIQQVKKNTSKPVLCKDFFISTYQVYEARYYGADAILLMLSVLNDERL